MNYLPAKHAKYANVISIPSEDFCLFRVIRVFSGQKSVSAGLLLRRPMLHHLGELRHGGALRGADVEAAGSDAGQHAHGVAETK